MFWKFYGIIRWNQKHPISCVPWKSCSGNFGEISRNSFKTEHILKAHNYSEYELCHWCFSRNFRKILTTVILKENLPMDVPYLINPLTTANGKFCCRLCMQNLVVTDISVREAPILQTGISLIKNIYQSEVFFWFASQYFIKASYIENQPGKCYNNAYSSNTNHFSSWKFQFFLKNLPG